MLKVAWTRFLCPGWLHREVSICNHPGHKKRVQATLLFFLSASIAYADCKPANRIISLAPDITETLYAIGAGSQLVATIAESDYPEAAKKLPRVGAYNGLDMEAIIALKPDLIVTWNNHYAASLKKLSIPVYVTAPKRLEDIATSMRQLGCLSGHPAQADRVARQFMNQIAQLKHDHQGRTPPKVFFQIGDSALFTINKDSWIDQVITLCGGENVFRDAKITAPEVNEEAVLIANPAVIFSDATNDTWQKRWRRFPNLAATKYNRLISIQPDWIDRAGPRLLLGARLICNKI